MSASSLSTADSGALLVITAGRTGPNRSVRFGGDLSLDRHGRRTVSALAASVADDLRSGGTVICGPEASTHESCALLGVEFAVDDRLRTLDVGTWSGRTPEEVSPDELGAWFGDPAARPHGGETVVEFVARVHRWRDAMISPPCAACVVSMPVAQALLVDEATDFFAVGVAPATVYRDPGRR